MGTVQCPVIIRWNMARMDCYSVTEFGERGPISSPTPYIEWRCILPFAHGGRHESPHATPVIAWNS